jgi:hypothetical protein
MDAEQVAAAVARYVAALTPTETFAAYEALPVAIQSEIDRIGELVDRAAFLEGVGEVDQATEMYGESEVAWRDFKLVWAPEAFQTAGPRVTVRPLQRRRESHARRPGHRRARSTRAGPDESDPEPALAAFHWPSRGAFEALLKSNRGLVV